jgi:GNAT superfamily N-acetyltransferase
MAIVVFYLVSAMKLKIRPLTLDVWPAIVDLFNDSATTQKCCCMYFRTGAAYRKKPIEDNQAAFRRVVKEGPPPGLVAFDGPLAVGWCQLTPRAALPQLAREWRLKTVDDKPVWCISCLYVRKSHRRSGVSTALIDAALKAAKRAKAPALEAYPFDRDLSPSSTSTGFASTFARLGFKTVARHIPARPIMRHALK